MGKILYKIVELIAEIHNYLLTLNDDYELYFTDKELHFIIIGILGMAMVLVIYPIFRHLINKKRYLTLTWIYVFTIIIVITFAIEIGQKITNTGSMDFGDIVFGVVGFMAMYLTFALMVGIYRLLMYLFTRHKNGDSEKETIKNIEKFDKES